MLVLVFTYVLPVLYHGLCQIILTDDIMSYIPYKRVRAPRIYNNVVVRRGASNTDVRRVLHVREIRHRDGRRAIYETRKARCPLFLERHTGATCVRCAFVVCGVGTTRDG